MAADENILECLKTNMEILRDDIINSGMSVQKYVKKHALEINGGKALMTYGGPTIWIEGDVIHGSWNGAASKTPLPQEFAGGGGEG